MLDTKDRPSECVKCKRYQKQIERLKKAIIKTDVESVRQSMQHEDEISDLNDKYSYTYEQFQNAKAQIKQLKAESSSGNQSKKKALEKVGSPNSNANLRAPLTLNPEVKENDHH